MTRATKSTCLVQLSLAGLWAGVLFVELASISFNDNSCQRCVIVLALSYSRLLCLHGIELV